MHIHTHTQTLSLSHTHTRTLSHTHTRSFSHTTYAHLLEGKGKSSVNRASTQRRDGICTQTHTHTHTLSLSLSLSRTHTHALSHTHTRSLIHITCAHLLEAKGKSSVNRAGTQRRDSIWCFDKLLFHNTLHRQGVCERVPGSLRRAQLEETVCRVSESLIYSPLQVYVAVCCSLLQCVSVCCSALQCVAVSNSVLQRVAASGRTPYVVYCVGLYICAHTLHRIYVLTPYT